MFIFKSAHAMQQFLSSADDQANCWGFVPTMGALHEGHLSLIRQAASECEQVVCSIFVNPTQFNDPADLEKYPRTEAADIEALLGESCDLLFLPTVEVVYPKNAGPGPEFEFNSLDQVMEGRFRPGHFKGVAQVVHRLLSLVKPDRLYMGQKDFQQVAVVREMLRQSSLNVQLISCPTVREGNGLAMSSRNVRLNPEQRQQAGLIYQVLQSAKERIGLEPLPSIREWAMQQLTRPGEFAPEYFEIVDGNTLQTPADPAQADFLVACTAVQVGPVRLIDNLILKQ